MGSQRNSRCGAKERRITEANKWGRGNVVVLGRGF
jgi:hypothetical protein